MRRSSPARAVALACLAATVAGGCAPASRKTPPELPRDAAAPALSPSPIAQSAAPAPAPPAPAPAQFIGSLACGECHKKQLQRWQKDWHARALSAAAPGVVVGRFDGSHFIGTSSQAQMRRSPKGPGPARSGYLMRTAGPDGQVADFAVDWVIGGKRMQDTVTILPDGRWQVLPVYYHVTGGGAWVDYNEAQQGAIDPAHPFYWTNWRRNANHECLDCHTTGLRVRFDRVGLRLTTEFADAAVACESCHGPGSRHAETLDKADIVHPGKAPPQVALALCAQCHGPRNPLFPMLDFEHRFRAGERYENRFQPLVVVNGSGRSGDYFADGRPKTSSFEYQALLQSRCFRTGLLTCLTCHTAPHAEHAQDELKPVSGTRSPAAVADASCRTCHPQQAASAAQHARHRSAAATSCVACHMPRIVAGVLDRFADHSIDIPVPQNSDTHEIPSACGLCHKDKTSQDLQAALLRLWPDAGSRQQRRLRLADAIDEKTAERSRPALLAVLADVQEAETLRGACAILLAQRFPRGAVEVLVPLLKSPTPLLRAQVIEALGYTKSKEATPAVAEHLQDPELSVRQAAALVLKALDDPRAELAARELAGNPQSAGLMQPHYILAQLAFRRGDQATAISELESAVQRVPYATDALIALSEVYLRRGQIDLARARISEALFFDPHNAVARQRLAKLQ